MSLAAAVPLGVGNAVGCCVGVGPVVGDGPDAAGAADEHAPTIVIVMSQGISLDVERTGPPRSRAPGRGDAWSAWFVTSQPSDREHDGMTTDECKPLLAMLPDRRRALIEQAVDDGPEIPLVIGEQLRITR